MTYTNWGYYEYNDATGQFDTWVSLVPGSTPPLIGETRDEYEARQLALQESPEAVGPAQFNDLQVVYQKA